MVIEVFTTMAIGACVILLAIALYQLIGYFLQEFVFNHGGRVGMWRIVTFLVSSLIVGLIVEAIRV